MRKKLLQGSLVLFLFALSGIASLHAQDTTSFRMAAFTDSGEMLLFHEDSTEVYVGVIDAAASYNALFYHSQSGNLYCLHDSLQGTGDRNFYVFDPFTEQVSLAYDPTVEFLAAACVTPSGRIFAVTGNSVLPGEIYEIDIQNQTETLLTTTNWIFGSTQCGLNITYYPPTNELWLFAGGVDSLVKINLTTLAEQRVSCFLNGEADIKGTYLDGDVFWLASNASYTLDVNQGLSVMASTFPLYGYITDFELLDLIEGPDTLTICDGDSVTLTSRFSPDDYHWYLDTTALGVHTSSITVGAPGTYRLLAQSDNGGGYYMWSEEIVVNVGSYPVANFGQSADTVTVGTAVNFSDSSAGSTGYVWDFGDGNSSTLASPAHTYATAGTYSVMMIVANGMCMDTAYGEVVVLPLVGNAEPNALRNVAYLQVFPNPASTDATIRFELSSAESVRIEILNAVGQLVSVQYEGLTDAGTHTIRLNNTLVTGKEISSGLYLVRLSTPEGSLLQRMMLRD